jgi:hypothetical protein
MAIAECGLKEKTQKSEIRNPKYLSRMVFTRNALASGPGNA